MIHGQIPAVRAADVVMYHIRGVRGYSTMKRVLKMRLVRQNNYFRCVFRSIQQIIVLYSHDTQVNICPKKIPDIV